MTKDEVHVLMAELEILLLNVAKEHQGQVAYQDALVKLDECGDALLYLAEQINPAK